VPDGPACGRRRARPGEPSRRAGSRDRRTDRRAGTRCARAGDRPARRCRLAEIHRRHLSLLSDGSRELVRPAAVHRLHPRWRLCQRRHRRCAVRVCAGRAGQIGIATHTKPYPLDRANQALEDLRAGRFEGAAVLIP
jgi:hypothetical protein